MQISFHDLLVLFPELLSNIGFDLVNKCLLIALLLNFLLKQLLFDLLARLCLGNRGLDHVHLLPLLLSPLLPHLSRLQLPDLLSLHCRLLPLRDKFLDVALLEADDALLELLEEVQLMQ